MIDIFILAAGTHWNSCKGAEKNISKLAWLILDTQKKHQTTPTNSWTPPRFTELLHSVSTSQILRCPDMLHLCTHTRSTAHSRESLTSHEFYSVRKCSPPAKGLQWYSWYMLRANSINILISINSKYHISILIIIICSHKRAGNFHHKRLSSHFGSWEPQLLSPELLCSSGRSRWKPQADQLNRFQTTSDISVSTEKHRDIEQNPQWKLETTTEHTLPSHGDMNQLVQFTMHPLPIWLVPKKQKCQLDTLTAAQTKHPKQHQCLSSRQSVRRGKPNNVYRFCRFAKECTLDWMYQCQWPGQN